MNDDGLTGPWLLALGALAIAVGAAARILRRQRNDDDTIPRGGSDDGT